MRALLAVAILVPTLAVGAQSVRGYTEATQRAEGAAELVELVDLAEDLELITLWMGAEREVESLQARLMPIGIDLRNLDQILGSGETRDPLAVVRTLITDEIASFSTTSETAMFYTAERAEALDLFVDIAAMHASVDAGTVDSVSIQAFFDVRIDRLQEITNGLLSSRALDPQVTDLIAKAQNLDELGIMLRASFQELYASTGLLITLPGDAVENAQLLNYTTARAVSDDAERRFLADAAPETLALWQQYEDEPLVREWRALRDTAAATLGLTDGAASSSLDPISYGALGFDQAAFRTGLLRDAAARIAADAHELRIQAVQEQRSALLLAAAILLAGLSGIALVSNMILRPLRRLERQANHVANGQLDLVPLGPIGPVEVASVATTMDAMVETLRRVSTQMERITTDEHAEEMHGDSHEDNENVADLPGPLGRNVRESLLAVRQLTGALRASESRARAVVGGAADGILTVTVSGRIVDVNPAAERLLGGPRDSLVETPLDIHFNENDRRELRLLLDNAAAWMPARDTLRLADPGLHREVALSVKRHDAGPHMTMVVTDVSAQLRLERELHRQAHTDSLTGRLNRTGALKFLADKLADVRPNHGVALLFADLNGFRHVNDALGHHGGDRVLQVVGEVLQSVVSDGDHAVGRIGGDEFVIILSNTSRSAAARIANEMARVVPKATAPHVNNPVTICLGVAVATDYRTEPAAMLMDADLALRAAKARGRVVQVCDDGLRAAAERRRYVEQALGKAIGTDALRLHLQPVIDIETGKIVSAEALARWTDGGAPVSPVEFIGVAETSSLIIDFDRWALLEAATIAVRVASASPDPLPIAVNISWRHVRDGDLVADVTDVLHRTGCPPQLLRLELTESLVPSDSEQSQQTLRTIRELGIGLSLDDFGTGYTSINQLRRFPFDTVKIDRSLVIEMRDQGQQTLVDVVLQLGKILGLSVIGEGVETTDHAEQLKRAGCPLGQGWLWNKAMSVDAFIDRVEAQIQPRVP